MARRNLLEDASYHHFVGNLMSRPLADRALPGLLADQRHYLTGLFRRDLRRPPGARFIAEPLVHRQVSQRHCLQANPAPAPTLHGIYAHAQFPRNLTVILSRVC
jgi:hypothetical protein